MRTICSNSIQEAATLIDLLVLKLCFLYVYLLHALACCLVIQQPDLVGPHEVVSPEVDCHKDRLGL